MATYYLKSTGGMIELRQTRFKDRKTEHPHDVCAIGRSKGEVLAMYDRHLSGGVEGEREA